MKAITLVKLGGSLLDDHAGRASVLGSIARLWASGTPLVLVHGGGKHIDRIGAGLGLPRRTHQGLRLTDGPTLEVVVAVLAGLVNKTLVTELAARGVPAVGLSGADGILDAVKHDPVDGVDLGHVGRITRADATLVHLLLSAGRLPVVAALASGGGQAWNVNADTAAAALAAALPAGELLFLTDVEGVRDGSGRLLPSLDEAAQARLLSDGTVNGGMRPKLEAGRQALRAGVAQVVVAGPSARASGLWDRKGGTCLVHG